VSEPGKPGASPKPKAKAGGRIWDRASMGREASAGYDLVGNIVFCLFLAWALKRWAWPAMPKLGYGIAVILGAASGFYQLFKSQSRPAKKEHDPKPD
jgi:hypothetical protein